jgi:hypothetical protein
MCRRSAIEVATPPITLFIDFSSSARHVGSFSVLPEHADAPHPVGLVRAAGAYPCFSFL